MSLYMIYMIYVIGYMLWNSYDFFLILLLVRFLGDVVYCRMSI